MTDGKARLFVALDLPAEVTEAIEGWQQQALARVPEVRPVKREALHVTLCFLGWREPGEIEEIGAAATAVAAAVPNVALGGPVWLSRRRPRVLALAVQDEAGACASLQSAVSDALARGAWYEPERRPFLPHVTVGRVRGAAPRRDLHTRELPAVAALRFSGAAVTLYRSRPTAAGATYEPLARAALAAD